MTEQFHIPLVPPADDLDGDDRNIWHPPQARYLWCLRLFLLVALGFAIYLAIIAMAPSASGCDGTTADCDDVLESRWSEWFGIPVSFLAVAVYGSMLVATFFIEKKIPDTVAQLAWGLLLVFSTISIFTAIWFIGLQVGLLEKYCKYCLTAHSFILLSSILIWYKAPFSWRIGGKMPEESDIAISAGFLVMVFGLTLVSVGSLAGGQWFIEPEGNIEVELYGSKSDSVAKKSTQPVKTRKTKQPNTSKSETKDPVVNEPLEPRVVHFLGSEISIDITKYPILGPVDAEQVVIKLFDYTCSHCRKRHKQLEEVRRRCGDRLAIVLIPAPLSNGCNPHVHGSDIDNPHQFACYYAKLGLNIWLSDRSKFPDFHDQMFKAAEPPSRSESGKFAAELVGDRAISDHYVAASDKLKECVEIYKIAIKKGKRGLPMVLTAEGKVTGKGSTNVLIKNLRKAGLQIPEE